MTESTWPNCARYFKEDHDKLITKFIGSETIENNYSQAMQDMFVLTMLDGKKMVFMLKWVQINQKLLVTPIY